MIHEKIGIFKENSGDSADLVSEQQFSLESEKELQIRVAAEQKEVEEVFKDLIEMISKRYESMPEKMREDYVIHNKEILHNVIELGMRKGFSPEELKESEVAAILHDMTKGDAAPEKFKNIKFYSLAIHGEKAAEESKEILTDEYLSQHGFLSGFENIRENISASIREHMGPHPGFMSDTLEGVNKNLREMNEKEIEHPEAQGKMSETLLAADMAALASEKGRKKILTIREIDPSCIKNDLDTITEYKKVGIDLKQGEAALISGFESAFQAKNMIKSEQDRKWIEKIIRKKAVAHLTLVRVAIDIYVCIYFLFEQLTY